MMSSSSSSVTFCFLSLFLIAFIVSLSFLSRIARNRAPHNLHLGYSSKCFIAYDAFHSPQWTQNNRTLLFSRRAFNVFKISRSALLGKITSAPPMLVMAAMPMGEGSSPLYTRNLMSPLCIILKMTSAFGMSNFSRTISLIVSSYKGVFSYA